MMCCMHHNVVLYLFLLLWIYLSCIEYIRLIKLMMFAAMMINDGSSFCICYEWIAQFKGFCMSEKMKWFSVCGFRRQTVSSDGLWKHFWTKYTVRAFYCLWKFICQTDVSKHVTMYNCLTSLTCVCVLPSVSGMWFANKTIHQQVRTICKVLFITSESNFNYNKLMFALELTHDYAPHELSQTDTAKISFAVI